MWLAHSTLLPMVSLDAQGTRSILSGIQNLNLQSRGPTLISRQQGQLPPPLLTASVQPYTAALPSLLQAPAQYASTPGPTFASPKGVDGRSRQLTQSVSKGSIRPSSLIASSLLSGRSPVSQPLTRTGTPGLFARTAAPAQTPAAKVQSSQQDMFATPTAELTSAVEQEFRTPGTLTQDEWNAIMQTGRAETTAGSQSAGKGKKGFRPAVKKQRIGRALPNFS